MASAAQWVSAARPRTLPAALAPVLVGTGLGIALTDRAGGEVALGFWLKAVAALIVALALQVGVNYANDYSDGIRGTDGEHRVGPFRLVGSGSAAPKAVKLAAFACFGVAGVAGLALAIVTAWWLVIAGAACIAAAWFYTGGRHPYGYAGLGELFVFVFFGLVAVTGTTYVLAGRVTAATWLLAVGTGLIACAILVVNNLRDVAGDRRTGKRTLAVMLGDNATRVVYATLLVGALAAAVSAAVTEPGAWYGLVALLLAIRPMATVLRGASGPALIPVLGQTGLMETVYGLSLLIGLIARH